MFALRHSWTWGAERTGTGETHPRREAKLCVATKHVDAQSAMDTLIGFILSTIRGS